MLSTFMNAENSNGKPKIVHHYNMNMGGVDGADMLLHFYNDNRKSTKVRKKLEFNIIHRMCSNAYILYKKNTSDMPIKPRLRFVQEVIEEISREHHANRGKPVRGVIRNRNIGIQPIQGNKEKDCIVCSDRSTGQRRRSRSQCRSCRRGLHFACSDRHVCPEEEE
ncbi:piggyBac transposable element-derived protein 4-like [Saccostrea cucullata]|uniref:piggyBac transposable element-derived protein 4-like n=1 Tax=Saccostrea cuccullata TaxID=36930 RepID=UPI002ED353CA